MIKSKLIVALTSIFLFSNASAFAQSDNNAVTISLHQPKNYLYWGFDNELQISIAGINSEDIKLQSENLEIKGSNGNYILKVLRGQRSATLSIYENEKLIERIDFVCRPIPAAVLNLASFESGQFASVSEILLNPCLEINFSDKNVEATYSVISYNISYKALTKDGTDTKFHKFNGDGPCFSEEIKLALTSAKVVGDILIEVKYAGPDGIERRGGMRLTLADKIREELNLERKKVAEKDQALMTRELLMIQQDSVLSLQIKEIEQQQEAITVGKKDLEKQTMEINAQQGILKNQVVQIQNQRNLLITFIAVVVLISLLLYMAIRNFKQKKSAMAQLITQKELIEEKHLEIQDSITYAKRIQTAILPPRKFFNSHLKKSFVLYSPKDVVAGDFYWMEPKENTILFAAADCTGHGVPGAMVSVICNNALNRSVREFGLTKPGPILDKTREIIIEEFAKSEETVKDGMDIALCSLSGNILEFSGAHNPLWIIRSGALDVEEIKADNQPIGQFEHIKEFKTHTIKLEKGDSVYIFSDGFADQFGGEKGKKFKTANLKKLLLSVQDKQMDKQEALLDDAFENWKGRLEQLDDVCIIGVRF